jgi:hypothetical protein
MLNWAIRYHPFVKELKQLQPPWVLDAGSGAEGIKLFWRGEVRGIDIHFKRRPLHHGILASILRMPLKKHSCPVVISCDLLEHIQPEHRQLMITELSRVSQEHLIIGFPSGDSARQTYQAIAKNYGSREKPAWLQEHLDLGLPDAIQVEKWLQVAGWDTELTWYESARRHEVLIDLEVRYSLKLLTYSLMRLIGPELVTRLRFIEDTQEKPHMRVMIKATRSLRITSTRGIPREHKNNSLDR